jgi:hypothetical protein
LVYFAFNPKKYAPIHKWLHIFKENLSVSKGPKKKDDENKIK